MWGRTLLLLLEESIVGTSYFNVKFCSESIARYGGEKVLRDKIKQICTDRGISVKELERKADLSGNTVTRWDGSNYPNVRTLKKIATVLNVTIDELVEEDGQ